MTRTPAFVSSDGEPVFIDRLVEMPLIFAHTGDGEHPYFAKVFGKTLTIRINDFPAEPLYSLIVDDENVGDLDDWPAAWRKPSVPRGGSHN